tara:strand:+ start:430 stop:738 length:309 start_codon:yes stop_codon:yes gene_type:complete
MRKFLKLIDENRPGSNSQYVISIKGPAEFEDIQVSGDEYVYHLYRKIKDYVDGVEDNEILDREFQDKAQTDPEYATALKDREKAIDKKLIDYKKETQELETS